MNASAVELDRNQIAAETMARWPRTLPWDIVNVIRPGMAVDGGGGEGIRTQIVDDVWLRLACLTKVSIRIFVFCRRASTQAKKTDRRAGNGDRLFIV